MLDKITEHKLVILMTGLCLMLMGSISITLAYQNVVTDSIAITATVLLSVGLFLTVVAFIVEKVCSICNP